MPAEPSFKDMLAAVPQAFLNVLAQLPVRPRRILVETERTRAYLQPVCAALSIDLKPTLYLGSLEAAAASLFAFLDR